MIRKLKTWPDHVRTQRNSLSDEASGRHGKCNNDHRIPANGRVIQASAQKRLLRVSCFQVVIHTVPCVPVERDIVEKNQIVGQPTGRNALAIALADVAACLEYCLEGTETPLINQSITY